METINEYLNSKKEHFRVYSSSTYAGNIQNSSVLFSFDYEDIINEVCFARLYKQMDAGIFSRNYIMRLPYSINDTVKELHTKYVDYPKFFENLSNLVVSLYQLDVYDTPYLNIKLVTLKNKMPIIKNLDYCITLVLFTMMRGVEGEYNNRLKDYKLNLSGDLKEYIYTISKNSRGSHHNINDVLDQIIQKKDDSIEDLKKLVVEKYIDTLDKTFGKDGLINKERYQTMFSKIFVQKPQEYGYAMQTSAFDFIQQTTNKFLMEE